MLSTSVQADRQGPSIITRWPDWRTAANSRRYDPTSPPALDTMRKSAHAGSSDTRNRTKVIIARGTEASRYLVRTVTTTSPRIGSRMAEMSPWQKGLDNWIPDLARKKARSARMTAADLAISHFNLSLCRHACCCFHFLHPRRAVFEFRNLAVRIKRRIREQVCCSVD